MKVEIHSIYESEVDEYDCCYSVTDINCVCLTEVVHFYDTKPDGKFFDSMFSNPKSCFPESQGYKSIYSYGPFSCCSCGENNCGYFYRCLCKMATTHSAKHLIILIMNSIYLRKTLCFLCTQLLSDRRGSVREPYQKTICCYL